MDTAAVAAAAGQWPRLLIELAGLKTEQLQNRHQPCPACGGSDRYRWDNDSGAGGWFCNQCGGKERRGGGGNGMDLLLRLTGWDYATAVRRIEAHLALPPAAMQPAARRTAGRPLRTPAQPQSLRRRRRWGVPAPSGVTATPKASSCSGCSDLIFHKAARHARPTCSAPGLMAAGTTPHAAILFDPTGRHHGRSTACRSSSSEFGMRC